MPRPRAAGPQTVQESGCFYRTTGQKDGRGIDQDYISYAFVPNPDPAIQEAKSYLVSVANEMARRKAKGIIPPASSELVASATRNVLDGNYSVYVIGKVVFVTTPKSASN